MLIIRKRWFKRVWFASQPYFSLTDIYFLCEVSGFSFGFIEKRTVTFSIPLYQHTREFELTLKSRTRMRYRRAEEAGCKLLELKESKHMVELYRELKKGRGLKGPANFPTPVKGEIKSWGVIKEGRLLAGCTLGLSEKAGKAVVLFQTSAFRKYSDPGIKRLCSNASVWMFCELAAALGEKGYTTLDFGGPDPDIAGLREFKNQFPGNWVESSCYFPLLYALLQKIRGKGLLPVVIR